MMKSHQNLIIALIWWVCALAARAIPAEMPVESWAGQTVMLMYAHIDDAECLAGGLVSQLKDYDINVHFLVMTNGDKGCSNPDICANITSAELIETRQQEQYASAEVLGIPQENIHFLGYEDVQLKQANRTEVSYRLVELVRQVKPSVVLTWDSTPHFNMLPSQYGDLGYHPDHQYSGELTVDAIWQAKLDLLWPELGAGWRVSQTYFWVTDPEGAMPTHYFDISGAPVKLKTEALAQMESQLSDGTVEAAAWMVALGHAVAVNCQLPQGSLAEGFQYVLW